MPTITEQLVQQHLVGGELIPDAEIRLRVDRVLLQDATGTLAALEFEALGVPRVQVEHAAVYLDHNLLQTGFENADDHAYLRTFAAKYGLYYSKPGNGICHQVNLERFATPGKLLLGTDSHTPTAGGAAMLGIGVGGLDAAVALAGQPYSLRVPRVLGVRLTGALSPWVSGKDVILELLRRLTVRGGVGYVTEYFGPGVATLTVPQRATIANMGAELGATSSIFPSDEATRQYLERQGRGADWHPLAATEDAPYDKVIEVDLSELEPLIALPGSPDHVKPVREVEGTEVQQVLIGSCTNSSYEDLMLVAAVLRERRVVDAVSVALNPGSRQVLQTVSKEGALSAFFDGGMRLLENGCNGCIGMGSAPGTDWVSLRAFNRNWPGRSGTSNDRVYLASVATCIASAVHGRITDPRRLGPPPDIRLPDRFVIDDSMILPPASDPNTVEIRRGPNIVPLPEFPPLSPQFAGRVLLRLGDNISTDAILPGGAEVLPLRSNLPAISGYAFRNIDSSFPERALASPGGVIVAGHNYGQGSSREHAALVPRYLGVQAVLAVSFARIHRANLVNWGILPAELRSADYERLHAGDVLMFDDVRMSVLAQRPLLVRASGRDLAVSLDLSEREREILLAGGALNYVRSRTEIC